MQFMEEMEVPAEVRGRGRVGGKVPLTIAVQSSGDVCVTGSQALQVQLMAKTFADTLNELLKQIEPAAKQMECARDGAHLRELSALLREALIDLLALLERDPGIEMAVADLYASAETLACEGAAPSRSHPRRLRLFRDASVRLRDCLGRARPSEHARNVVWRSEEFRALAS